MDENTDPRRGFAQELLSSISTWIEQLEQLIQVYPDHAVQVGLGLVVLALAALLISAARLRRQRDLIHRQAAEIARLSKRLEAPEIGSSFKPQEAPTASEQAKAAPSERETHAQAGEPTAVTSRPAAGEVTAELLVEQAREEALPEAPESKISKGLAKSRSGLLGRLAGFFSGRSSIDTSTLDDLEEVLILSDVGARCASDLVGRVKETAQAQGSLAPAELTGLLKEGIHGVLLPTPSEHRLYTPNTSPLVILVVGVNGVGKTTTVAKLAAKYTGMGKKVVAIAADTFRAAAVEQLAEWSSRVGFTLVKGPEGSKPSAVVFDGMVAAIQGSFDVVLIDTAGRLHTKSNLMQELEGIRNVIKKHVPEGPHETLLVVDGVSGQNALSQAREFNTAVKLSGLVVTKLDGTPKGGIIVAISQELKIPVFFIGVGESVGDLIRFDRQAFVEALFEEKIDDATSHRVRMHAQVGNS